MVFQPILDLVEVLSRLGIRSAVLSPGSRSAPVALAFARHPAIRCRVVSDERSAGYIALGMAQSENRPVVVVCTSGTAALQLSPAMAEAHYQNIPLIAITADRPPEWIDQHDGQAIHQPDLYGKMAKACYRFPVDFGHPDSRWHCNRIASEIVHLSLQEPAGPVHLNLPLREPLYPKAGETWSYPADVRVIDRLVPATSAGTLPSEIMTELASYKKVMIVAGQQPPDTHLDDLLFRCAREKHMVVIAELISNLRMKNAFIRHHDAVLARAQEAQEAQENLYPDLLISYGGPILSKPLKQFLRTGPRIAHWRIDPSAVTPDTYQNLTRVLSMKPEDFFRAVIGMHGSAADPSFAETWSKQEQEARQFTGAFFPRDPFGEFETVYHVLKKLPENSVLHLANSMPVRYASYLSLCLEGKNVRIAANRGTSGIDGCLSTAVGFASASGALHLLLTGDMAFQYDRNAFWSDPIPPNLKVVILNNHGGGSSGCSTDLPGCRSWKSISKHANP
jgi:2-succinyl-5-enolpyruvyl-6-hydroxy-3-cyclohexene-1-carboxylate synthase